MKKEEKQLLLKDLCARLPYGVKVKITEKGVLSYDSGIGIIVGKEHIDNEIFILKCKNDSWCLTAISEFVPYLRPMESMTDEEKSWYESLRNALTYQENGEYDLDDFNELNDFLNRRKLDKYGLIEKGLALEAKEGMYND